MMVGKRHFGPGRQAGPAAVPLYGFQPPVGTPYNLEVTTVEDFFAQHDDWPWNPPFPGRATFHYLIAVTEGELWHDVDYVTRTVAPGQWLWVRPGHAQCWHPPGAARGPFILFEPDVLRPDLARLLAPLTAHEAPAVLSPHPDDTAWLQQTALQLLDEHRALGRRPLDLHHALRCSLLESLLLRLANSPGIAPIGAATAGTGRADRYGRFLDALELHFRELHQAADYAELLRCSVRTLSRATRDATGKGVRELIDERRLLEARRLLGSARWDARTVALHLGFTDPANFGRFFRDRTGLTPAAFAAGETTVPPRDCKNNGVTPYMEETPVTIETMAKREPETTPASAVVDQKVVAELVARASAEGVSLTGEGGLLQQLTKLVLESSLEGELDAHLGYGKHDRAGRDGGNSRNGRRAKTVVTEIGPVEVEVPRDRDGSFEPKIVRKRQRRLDGVDGIVLSLSAKGLTTGEISAHLAEVYGASVSKDTISAITDRVLEAMGEWQSRPLDPVYPVVFVDAIRVKIRDGNVVNRPIYLAMGVTVDGERDILGLWAGEHGDGEGAKYWLRVLTELKNRGVRDVLMLVCDGLKGLPDAVNTVWDKTIVQTCVIHLLRNSFKYTSRRDWPELARDLKLIYTAPSADAALDQFAEFSDKWEKRCPAVIRLWTDAWAEFVPFLAFDVEIRKIICTTNAIESVNARLRRAVNARGHFPTELAALKCLYMALMGLDPTGRGRGRWVIRWKAALNAFDVAFEGRLTAGRN